MILVVWKCGAIYLGDSTREIDHVPACFNYFLKLSFGLYSQFRNIVLDRNTVDLTTADYSLRYMCGVLNHIDMLRTIKQASKTTSGELRGR
jgi:hypothetical protein